MASIRRTAGMGIVSGSLLAVLGVTGVQARQEKPAASAITPQQAMFFESKVRPVLVNNCYGCHAGNNIRAGISLDSPAGLLKGNARGPVLVPGDPDKSVLIHVLNYDGKVKMPPAGKLRAEEIAALTAWVKMGAPWPEAKKTVGTQLAVSATGGKPEKIVSAKDKNTWPFKPFSKPALPVVKNAAWCQSPIDKFIMVGLEAKGLKPSAPASKRDLLRRAYFDLIGIPPTPADVDAFLADKSPNAFAKVVDKLLAMPQYGERWGRHWLDVARYADSNGLDENTAFGNAFRYRDYIVNAFNKDKPYDQLVREQLAGDLLPASTDEERNEHLTATGFLSLGPKVLAEPDKPKMVMDIVDEQIEVTSKAFLGLTVACARCHDHKFDPIPTKDYYALAGIFKSTRTMETLNTVARCYERPLVTSADKAQAEEQQRKVKQLEDDLKRETGSANRELATEQRANLAKYLLAGWELVQQPGMQSLAELPAHAGDTRLFVEAEKFDRGNANRDFDNYGKGIGVIHTVTVPTFAEWDINVPKAGNYQIEMRYTAMQSRPVKLLVNGKVVNPKAAGSVTGSWNPDGQKWEVQGVYLLAAGKNILKIESNGDIPHIDKLMLVAAETGNDRNGKPVRTLEQIAKSANLNPAFVQLWASRLRVAQNDPIMGAFVRYAHVPADRFSQNAPLIAGQLADAHADPAIVQAFAGFAPATLEQVASKYQDVFSGAQQAKDGALAALNMTLTTKNGLLTAPGKPDAFYPASVAKAIKEKQQAVAAAKTTMTAVPMALAVDEGKIENVRVHLRGNTQTLGDEVPRHFLSVVADGDKTVVDDKHSGRLELAQWITRPDHPLTSRVEVNRIWQEHFGQGIVRTPENFGLLSEKPTHPELLDWLASTFVEKGWSIKQIHRTIMLSSAYQMSTQADEKATLADPDNKMLSHFARRRLEAEPFRDSLLFVAGKLDTKMGGSLLGTKNNDYVTNDQSGNAAQYNAPRRSIYLPIIRNALFDMFQAFDMGDPSMVNARRSTTTVSPQALFMMNSPFVQEQALAFAQETLKGSKADPERINYAYRKAYSRSATPTEAANAAAFLTRYGQALTASTPDASKRQEKTWQALCQVLLSANEFIYVN